MGVLDSLFGADNGSKAQTATGSNGNATEKYAIVLNAGPDEVPKAGNAFNYVTELDDGGYEVQLFLDGQAARWPSEFEADPDKPFGHDWNQVRERGLLAGVCGFCAEAFDATEACQNAGIDLLSESDEHAPAIAQLADDDYEILTIG